MSKRQATTIIKAYAEALADGCFDFERIYLFGSQARGRGKATSDIDVAVVSRRRGSGKTYLQQKMRLWKLAIQVDPRIEPVLLAPEDLRESTASIIGDQVRKYGIRVR